MFKISFRCSSPWYNSIKKHPARAVAADSRTRRERAATVGVVNFYSNFSVVGKISRFHKCMLFASVKKLQVIGDGHDMAWVTFVSY